MISETFPIYNMILISVPDEYRLVPDIDLTESRWDGNGDVF